MSQIRGGNINNNIGDYYDPNKNKNYISELNKFNLHVRKNNPNFPNLKATIEDLIEILLKN